MYKVKMDGRTLYYPGDKEAILTAPTVRLQTGYAGTFEFTVPMNNPLYDQIQNRRSMVSVYRDSTEIFYGEVRKQPKIDRYKNKSVYCAGAMSFLSDSIQPQAEYHDMSPRQMLETFLNFHNSQVEDRKKIYVGIVTITDSNDSLYRYTNFENTLKAIREKLVDKLGGYLRLRHESDGLYLDWIKLEEYGKYCEQPIEFGLNLLEYSESTTAESLVTALIPLGAQLQGESEIEALQKYVDITSVNGGVNYIYSQEAVETFGWVWTTNTWQDVTEPSNLLRKGKEWLQDNQFEELELTLTAVDLSAMDKEYDSFDIGDRIHCRAKPYGMDRQFPVMEMTIPLQQPDNAKLTLGGSRKISFTEYNRGNAQYIKQQLENNRVTTAWLQSAIDNATAMMTGSKGGYKVSEYDSDGRWLRDLYMNAPSKEEATQVMQINMNGIGFSRDGFDGPYKNAWTIDGVFAGEFIKAGSIQGEALSSEYKASVTDEINTTVTAKFKVAEDLISAEVTRATGQEVELAAAIQITSEQIDQKVSKGDVSSQLSLEAGQITLSGPRLKIDTEKFKLEVDGACQIIDGYVETSNDTRLTSMWGGALYFGDKSTGLDAGMLSFVPASKMLCVGGYGKYEKLGLGYWGSNTQFNSMITLESTTDKPGIQFNTDFSIQGRTGLTQTIGFVKEVTYGPDNTLDKAYGTIEVYNGIIVNVQ